MGIPGGSLGGPRRPYWRPHDGNGMTNEARAVVKDHRLNMDEIMKAAGHYAPKAGVDFNRAPHRDFAGAPLGKNLYNTIDDRLVPAADLAVFDRAKAAPNHATADAIMSSWLKGARIAGPDGANLYGEWRHWAERLEGFNVALYWAVRNAAWLYRFIQVDELGNYLRGRWRQTDDTNRVSLTVGQSNPFLGAGAEAMAAYDARSLAGCIQPVRYSPYPRMQDSDERFGSEKDATYAGEGEVHLYTGCRIPAADHVNIDLLGPTKHRRNEFIGIYRSAAFIR